MSDEPVMATTWRQCADHVEEGGVVEVRPLNGMWVPEGSGVGFYRSAHGGPGRDGYFPRRLLPLPATASDPSVAIEVPEGHELVVLPCETVDEVRGWKAGAGLKVPATGWQTIWHLASGCKAAVARRPKPAPKTERVHWSEAVGRKDPHDGTITMIGVTRIYFGQDSWMDVTDPDGMVEVLIEDQP